MGSGGGAAAAAAPSGGSAGGATADVPAEEEKKEEKAEGTRSNTNVRCTRANDCFLVEKEESDEDMGFGLFD